MSQIPAPYQPPSGQVPIGYYGPTSPDPLAGARAGALMIVLGAMMMVFGVCAGAVGTMLPKILPQLPAEQANMLREIEQKLNMPVATLYIAMGIVMLVGGVLYVILGIVTRGGSLGAIISALVLTSLTILLELINTIFSIAGGPIAVCFGVFVSGLFIWLLIWLIQAAKASGSVRNSAAQYQAQLQYYLQMQHMYGQAGYGYGVPVPPPPESSTAPSNERPTGQP